MILSPSEKYINYIENSRHYLNCPKHMFNHQIHSIIRLCHGHLDIARQRVRDAFTYYNMPLKDIDKLIEWHWNISEEEFNKLNPNPYIDKLPQHIIERDNRINAWIKTNTEPATIWGNYEIVPSYPFKH